MAKSRGKTDRENLENPFAPGVFEIKGAETLGSQCLVQDHAAHPGKPDERMLFPRDERKRGDGLPGETWRLQASGADEGPQKQTQERLLFSHSFGSPCSPSGLWSFTPQPEIRTQASPAPSGQQAGRSREGKGGELRGQMQKWASEKQVARLYLGCVKTASL